VNFEEALKSEANLYQPARRERTNAPSGFEPGIRYESSGVQVITTPPMEHLANEDDWQRAVEALGVEVPAGWRLRLVEARYDPAAWHRDAVGEDAVTRPVWRYRFKVEPDLGTAANNLDELVAEALKAKPPKPAKRKGVPATQVIIWADWQLFKSAGDGIHGTVDRITRSWAATLSAKREWAHAGFDVNDLVIIGNGDIVEGCSIYPNQAYEITGDMRDQTNAARRLIVGGVKALAPHYETVRGSVVGGNHGENRQNGKRVNRHDNGDAAVFEQAADVLAENQEAFGHVAWQIPRDELAATIDVRGWVLGHQHGHLSAGSGNPEAKMRGWYEKHAAAKTPVGDSHVLCTSHFHHERLADWGADDRVRSGCKGVQCAAMDGGSPVFADLFASESPPGLTTFLVTEDHRMERYQSIQL
jgi:hypothetical protein